MPTQQPPPPFRVALADWERDRETLRAIRAEVFIHGQGVLPDEEWDGEDEGCDHALVCAADTQRPIATGRLMPDGRIGRMAVCEPYRGRGVGGLLLRALLERARERGFTEVVLSAQVQAIPFYERHGFAAEGEVYLDARIPHRTMRRRL